MRSWYDPNYFMNKINISKQTIAISFKFSFHINGSSGIFSHCPIFIIHDNIDIHIIKITYKMKKYCEFLHYKVRFLSILLRLKKENITKKAM